MIKLTIITICLNDANGLEKTIKSISSQTTKNFEYIVIDGKSSDNTIEIINKYSNFITYWISEKDSGIYNAMNKGIKKSNGEYLFFLNSGDYLYNESIIEKFINYNLNADILCGILYQNDNEAIRIEPNLNYKIGLPIGGVVHHQACFIKKELFLKYGYYDESYKIVADQEFFIRVLFKYKVKLIYIPLEVSVYNSQANGISERNIGKAINEMKKAINIFIPKYIILYALLFNIFNFLINKIVKTLNIYKYFRFIKKRKINGK